MRFDCSQEDGRMSVALARAGKVIAWKHISGWIKKPNKVPGGKSGIRA
jgi:hypothetical protein